MIVDAHIDLDGAMVLLSLGPLLCVSVCLYTYASMQSSLVQHIR